MHHIHHSEAFVLGSRPKGEDSKILILYTRELGLIYAHAQGIRKISSKLRYIVQDFSHVNVDLVRGKEIWRLTTATPIRSHAHITKNRSAEKILARISSLLIRLVPGEEASLEVFKTIERTIGLLESHTKGDEDYRAIELLSVARILIALGYLSRGTPGADHESGVPTEFADSAYQHKLIRDINLALAATQL
ncbi:MAG: DNA repair protein RecO [Candidatus Pacebacteria bacterium]|nr:DNA repair protein RecO [Candidatus Paceibacterota bacterium]